MARKYPLETRPSLVEAICERLATGEPLAVICRSDGFPDPSTVWDWGKEDERVAQAIARARELGFDAIAMRARETARGAGDSAGDVQRDKLIIETDLKLLAKWDPKRYGDTSTTKHEGGLTLNVVTGVPRGGDQHD